MDLLKSGFYKNISSFLDYSRRFDPLQQYINWHNTDYNYYYRWHDFYIHNVWHQMSSLHDVDGDYDFSDLRPTDIFLDIGANIGGASLLASRIAKKVYAVEPIWHNEIRHNITVNNINNITVLESGLSDKNEIKSITYGPTRDVRCFKFSAIKYICDGHIDFLKCDCEGAEWYIKPEDLEGIRCIEMEVHNFDHGHNFNDYVKMLETIGFKVSTTPAALSPNNKDLMIIHARR